MRHLIIAFADQDVAQKIKALLISRGMPVRGICNTGAQVLQMAVLCEGGGVVICPARFPDMNAQELMSLLAEDFDMLVLVTPRQQGLIAGPGIFTLAQPFSAPTILDTIRQLLETRQIRAAASVVVDRVSRTANLPPDDQHQGNDGPAHNRSFEDQKVIEQAKYLLMNRRKMTESDAHRYLQKKSMESGIRLVELARRIIMPS